MKIFCAHCSRPFDAAAHAGTSVVCPHCGQEVPLPRETAARPARTAGTEFQREQQTRARILTALAVVVMLVVLGWLLFQRPAAGSALGRARRAVFGDRGAAAADQLAGNGQGGAGDGAGRGQNAGRTGNSTGQGGDSRFSSTAVEASDSPANPQLPEGGPRGLGSPPPRSIGELDRFFGDPSRTNGEARPGEGGTHASAPGAGNTNAGPATDLAAAQFTSSNAPGTPPADLVAPPRTVTTNRRAAPVAATLNDNLEQLLRQNRAGSGDVRVSLTWSNVNDLDLHVVDPRGEEIFYGDPRSASGGLLDIDMNAGPPLRSPAVENVFWPTRGAPAGTYRVLVNHYRNHGGQDPTAFRVRLLLFGETKDFTGIIRFGEPKKLVTQFTVGTGR